MLLLVTLPALMQNTLCFAVIQYCTYQLELRLARICWRCLIRPAAPEPDMTKLGANSQKNDLARAVCAVGPTGDGITPSSHSGCHQRCTLLIQLSADSRMLCHACMCVEQRTRPSLRLRPSKLISSVCPRAIFICQVDESLSNVGVNFNSDPLASLQAE